MNERTLFVDLENVQKVDLSQIPADVRVMVFYGITQKKLPEELVVQAQPLGARLKWIKISGQGPNALDFHIAYYLGQELAAHPTTTCVILSGDTGFDPLTRHLEAAGHSCRRIEALKGAFPVREGPAAVKEHPADKDPYVRLLVLLRKERARPSKRKGLAGKVKSWFPNLTEDARLALLQRLFSESRVRETKTLLSYDL
jgi:PIN domain